MKRRIDQWDAKFSEDSKQLGNPGKRWGYRVVPGGERLEGDFFTKMSNKRINKRKKQAAWFTPEARAMRKFEREISNKSWEIMPVKGPNGRWRPAMTASGSSLGKVTAGCVTQQIPYPDGVPQDTRYGKSVDFESHAQMNARVDSYSRSD